MITHSYIIIYLRIVYYSYIVMHVVHNICHYAGYRILKEHRFLAHSQRHMHAVIILRSSMFSVLCFWIIVIVLCGLLMDSTTNKWYYRAEKLLFPCWICKTYFTFLAKFFSLSIGCPGVILLETVLFFMYFIFFQVTQNSNSLFFSSLSIFLIFWIFWAPFFLMFSLSFSRLVLSIVHKLYLYLLQLPSSSYIPFFYLLSFFRRTCACIFTSCLIPHVI